MLFNKKITHSSGFTLIEVLVGTAVFVTVAVASYGAYASLFKLVHANEAKMLAVELASEQLEIVRNMPYNDIGIVQGVPRGIIPATTTATRGSYVFDIAYIIRDIDLPFDGMIGSSTHNDSAPADNKFVEISVSCSTCASLSPVIVSSRIAPKNLENSGSNGALFVQVINANGEPVSGASVNISYTATTSPVVINDVTDASGMLGIVDIPPAVQAYNIVVSKAGYSTDQTYTSSGSNPTPTKLPATVAAGQLTQISFSIDALSSISILGVNSSCVPVQGLHVTVSGAKEIGVSKTKYSQSFVTDGSGIININPIEWDTYTITSTDTVYDVGGLNPQNPVSVSPGTTKSIAMTAVAKNSPTLLVTVKDTATGLPLSDATIRLYKTGYDETRTTGQGYIHQTDWSQGAIQNGLFTDIRAYATGSHIDSATSTGNVLLANNGIDPYNIDLTGILESSTFDTGTTSIFSTLIWNPASQSPLTGADSLLFQIATSPSSTPVTWNFIGPDGTASTYYSASDSTISSANNTNRYARYKAFFHTDIATATPILSSVSATYTSGCIPPGQVTFTGMDTGHYSMDISRTGYTTQTIDIDISTGWHEEQILLQ